jgi:hypothetical protein
LFSEGIVAAPGGLDGGAGARGNILQSLMDRRSDGSQHGFPGFDFLPDVFWEPDEVSAIGGE